MFDAKMGEDLRPKALMLEVGHRATTPSSINYSSVVSRDSLMIALKISAFNNLKVLACNIQNTYLTAK